jgi:hypothetical protein
MRLVRVLLIILSLCLTAATSHGRMLYGYYIPEETLTVKARERVKTELQKHPLLAEKPTMDARLKLHEFNDRSFDFLAIILLVSFVGVFRLANPAYFRNLFRAFRNPTLSTRQLKEQLRQDSPASLTMDVIFCISMGMYLFYAVSHIHSQGIFTNHGVALVILALIVLLMVVYAVRFMFLKFTGWVFNISEITDNYTFNVFLINKILGIAIIPFTIILAFGTGPWVQVSLFLSFVLIAILFLNRYLRSGVVFGYFIKFSKFHFFMYLCASELLPLAVLMKLVSRWLVS